MTDALIDRGAQILAEHFDMTEWRFLGPEEREEYRAGFRAALACLTPEPEGMEAAIAEAVGFPRPVSCSRSGEKDHSCNDCTKLWMWQNTEFDIRAAAPLLVSPWVAEIERVNGEHAEALSKMGAIAHRLATAERERDEAKGELGDWSRLSQDLLAAYRERDALRAANGGEEYRVESVEWAHPNNDLPPDCTSIVVHAIIQNVGVGDTILYRRSRAALQEGTHE